MPRLFCALWVPWTVRHTFDMHVCVSQACQEGSCSALLVLTMKKQSLVHNHIILWCRPVCNDALLISVLCDAGAANGAELRLGNRSTMAARRRHTVPTPRYFSAKMARIELLHQRVFCTRVP